MNNSGHIFEKAAFLCFCFRKLIGKYTVIIYYYYHQLNIKLDKLKLCICINLKTKNAKIYSGPGGVLPYMGYIGMCRGIGYGF